MIQNEAPGKPKISDEPLPVDTTLADEQRPAQDPPLAPGLYLVATPIGNLEDITLRALRVLRSADRVACEDTRQTAKLLGHFGIVTPTVSYHAHNEISRAGELMEALKSGGRIAVVSDAGMPGIADPGATITDQAIAAGIAVFPIPGPNAAVSALVASGLAAESFTFHGFLPAREGQRRSYLEALHTAMAQAATDPEARHVPPPTHLFYEAPHRIVDSLAEIVAVFGPAQRIVLARELTKLHEEFLRGTAGEVLASLRARPCIRGEMVLLIDGAPLAPDGASIAGTANTVAAEIAALMRTEDISEKEALKRVAKLRGIGKSDAYREWQRSQSRKR